MNTMFRFLGVIKVFILSVLLVGFANTAQATHYAAADIHVDYVGTSSTDYTYRVTLNIYKACELTTGGFPNANLPTTTTLFWRSIGGCSPGSSVVMNTPIIDTLDKLCDTFKSRNSCR